MDESLIGFVGMSLVLLAFIMNQSKRWKNKVLLYDSMNLVGSSMLVFNAYMIKGWAFLILNAVWALISLLEIITHLLNKK